MHDGLPTLLSLKNRGIPTQSTCPLCNDEDEATHLFPFCPFARACWHGSLLAVHTTDPANVSVPRVGNLLDRHK